MTLLLRWVLTGLMALVWAGSGAFLGASVSVIALLAAIGGAAGYWLGQVGWVRPLGRLERQLQKLTQQTALVQSFMDNAPLVIAVKDRDRRYLNANAEFARMHGVSADSVLGKQDQELGIMSSDAAQTVRSNDQKVLETGQTLTYQIPVQSVSGLRQMESIKFPLYNGEQQVIGIGLVAMDVTERDASHEKFARVFHASPNWIVITRLSDGMVIDANEGFERLSGFERATTIGRAINELNIWANLEQRATIVTRLLRDGLVLDGVAQLRRKDGEVRDFLTNAALIDLEGKTKSHAVWIARDVTDEKAAHEQFVAAFRLTPDFMSITRAADGCYVEVNPAFERFTGYRRDEVIGRTSAEIGLWHDPLERERLMQTIASYQEARDFAVHLCDRHGTVRECLGYATVFASGGEDYLIAMVRDVTDARLAERALRESEARFAKLFEMSPVPTSYSFDTDDYAMSYRNDAFYAAFGYAKESCARLSAAEMGFWVDPQDGAKARELRVRAQAIDNWVVEVRHADGRHRWVSMFARVIEEPARKIVVTTLFDITEQRLAQQGIEDLNARLEDRVRERTEELRAANAELSQAMQTIEQARDRLVQSEKLASLGALVAGVAHELNTPIGNGLTVASSLEERAREFALALAKPLQRSTLDQFVSETQMASDLLVRSLSRAAALVSGFKQIAVDQTSSQRRKFDVGGLVDEVVLTISPATRRAHCAVNLDVAPGLAMDSYPGPLVQVMTNLIDNALVHALEPDREGHIDISARAAPPGQVEITVRDNGRGIAPHHVKRIFDPFFTTRLGQGGSGLGLHIVHNIVTNVLGGQIDVHTVVGEGTAFVLRLPLAAPEGAVAQGAQAQAPTGSP